MSKSKSEISKYLYWRDFKRSVREYFDGQGYLEVDTPVLVQNPGCEVHMQFFATRWQDYSGNHLSRWLRSSPELALKAIYGDLNEQPLYEIARCFRNGGELGPWHRPEFTMLEWYRPGTSLNDLMDETTRLIASLAKLESAIEIKRIRIADLFKQVLAVELLPEDPALAYILRKQGCVSVNEHDDYETAFFKAMLDHIEPYLKTLNWVMVYDYPPCTAALSAIDAGWAQRFECYGRGVELCNGFFEIVDANAVKHRMQEINHARLKKGFDTFPCNESYILKLGQINKSYVGNALGLDRLASVLQGFADITSTAVTSQNEWSG